MSKGSATLEGLGEVKSLSGVKKIVRKVKLCKGYGKNKKCINIGANVTVSSVATKDKARVEAFFKDGRKTAAVKKRKATAKAKTKTKTKAKTSTAKNGRKGRIMTAEQMQKIWEGKLNSARGKGAVSVRTGVCTMSKSKKKLVKSVGQKLLKKYNISAAQCEVYQAAKGARAKAKAKTRKKK